MFAHMSGGGVGYTAAEGPFGKLVNLAIFLTFYCCIV